MLTLLIWIVFQADLQSSVEGIERLDSPQTVFRNMLEAAAGQGREGSLSDLLDYIGVDEDLMNVSIGL